MRAQNARLAVLLKTTRSQVDRSLNPKRDMTRSSWPRAASLLGQRVVIELVEAPTLGKNDQGAGFGMQTLSLCKASSVWVVPLERIQ